MAKPKKQVKKADKRMPTKAELTRIGVDKKGNDINVKTEAQTTDSNNKPRG